MQVRTRTTRHSAANNDGDGDDDDDAGAFISRSLTTRPHYHVRIWSVLALLHKRLIARQRNATAPQVGGAIRPIAA
jgi:hypothetical protein